MAQRTLTRGHQQRIDICDCNHATTFLHRHSSPMRSAAYLPTSYTPSQRQVYGHACVRPCMSAIRSCPSLYIVSSHKATCIPRRLRGRKRKRTVVVRTCCFRQRMEGAAPGGRDAALGGGVRGEVLFARASLRTEGWLKLAESMRALTALHSLSLSSKSCKGPVRPQGQ